MADFDTETTSVRWYNVLSFHFMQPEVKRPVSRTLSHPKQVRALCSKVFKIINISKYGTGTYHRYLSCVRNTEK
jgi:hypothetical protein